MGVAGEGVYMAADDPNDVTAWHDFETLKAARRLADSARLREVMEWAGVAGKPVIWFTVPA